MPVNGTDAVSLFSFSFFLCLKWRQTALGKGEVRFVCVLRAPVRARVCVVCVGWRFR